MSNTTIAPQFWQGTNFWIALVLAAGGAFVGFPEGEACDLVSGLFGLIAGAGALREKLKGLAVVSWKDWLRSPNTWNYIGAAVTAIVPALPGDFFLRTRDLLDSVLGGNWQGVVTSLLSLATIIYFVFFRKGK